MRRCFIFSVMLLLTAIAAGVLPLALWGLQTSDTVIFDNYLWRTTIFTLVQASVSTLASLALSIQAARALARQNFYGKALLLRFLMLPQAIPALVAILGITSLYGTGGIFGDWITLYGFQGIVLAHVFFNAPLALRVFYKQLQQIAPENFRLGAQLSLNDWQIFRYIDWPHLRQTIGPLAGLIFLLCTTSFSVVLILGGGPRATNLEVAIFYALKADFDPSRALGLATIQFILCATIFMILIKFSAINFNTQILRLKCLRYDGRSLVARCGDYLSLMAIVFLTVPPIFMIILSGIKNIQFSYILGYATLSSLVIAILAGSLALFLGFSLGHGSRIDSDSTHLVKTSALWMSLLAWLGLIISPALLAAGWFVIIHRFSEHIFLTGTLIVLMNSLIALPLVYSTIAPSLALAARQNDRLARSLDVKGFTRFKYIDWPILKNSLRLALVFAVLASLGDLTAVSFFGSQDFMTLPALIYAQMSSYRTQAASGSALILLCLCTFLIIIGEYERNKIDQA